MALLKRMKKEASDYGRCSALKKLGDKPRQKLGVAVETGAIEARGNCSEQFEEVKSIIGKKSW